MIFCKMIAVCECCGAKLEYTTMATRDNAIHSLYLIMYNAGWRITEKDDRLMCKKCAQKSVNENLEAAKKAMEENQEAINNCETCAFYNVYSQCEPCASCVMWDKWTPKKKNS